MRRQRIVLDVEFNPTETDEPALWNWTDLADTVVHVLEASPTREAGDRSPP